MTARGNSPGKSGASGSAAAGLAFHCSAEEFVDAGLVAAALGFEPGEDVGIEADGQGFLDWAVEFSGDRVAPGADFGGVGEVDLRVPQRGDGRQFLSLFSRYFAHGTRAQQAAPLRRQF